MAGGGAVSTTDGCVANPMDSEQLQAIDDIVLAVRELMAELDREPTLDEIAARLGMPVDVVSRLVVTAQDLDA